MKSTYLPFLFEKSKSHFYNTHRSFVTLTSDVTNQFNRNKGFATGRRLICSSQSNDSIENRREVDPFIFVFHKWGISWNPVGLFFAFMVACYWNIFTQDRSLGVILGLEVYLLSLILPSEFFRGFQGVTKTGLVEWYLNQGYKVEQRVARVLPWERGFCF